MISQKILAWESSYSNETSNKQICTKIKLELVHLLQHHMVSFYTGQGMVGNSNSTQLFAEGHEAIWRKKQNKKIQLFCNI